MFVSTTLHLCFGCTLQVRTSPSDKCPADLHQASLQLSHKLSRAVHACAVRNAVMGQSHPALRIFHLPAADWGVMRDLLGIHSHAAAVLRLVCLPQDGIEGLQRGCLPPETSYHEGHLHISHYMSAQE